MAGNRVTDSERNTVITACNEHLSWLDQNQDASVEELESHLKTAQNQCQSTMMKLINAAGVGMGPPGAMAGPPGGFGGPPRGRGGPGSGGPRVTEL